MPSDGIFSSFDYWVQIADRDETSLNESDTVISHLNLGISLTTCERKQHMTLLFIAV